MLTKRDLVKIFGVIVLAESFLRWPVKEETANKIKAKAETLGKMIETSDSQKTANLARSTLHVMRRR